MADTEDTTIIEAGITLTDAQRQSIDEGMQWVRDWYQKRHDAGKFIDGADIGVDIQEYSAAMDNLDNLRIVATNDLYGSLEQMIMDKKVHLKDEVINMFDGDEEKAVTAMIVTNRRKKEDPRYAKASGLHFSYLKEPMLFLNVPLLEKEAQNLEAPSLSNTVAHEITHTLGLQINEAMTDQILSSGALREDVEPDAYLDNPVEVYARVKEFCKSFKLDPTKEITLDEVQKIREECEKKRADYEKNGGAVPKDLDHHLFDRYTDEKIVELINYTAMNDTLEPDTYEKFRASARADLAFSQHKIAAAEKALNQQQSADKVSNLSEKTLADDVVQQVVRDSKQYS